MNAIENTVRLGGYLVSFSILDGCISHLLAAAFSSFHPVGLLIRAAIEVTNGLHLLAISSLPWPAKFVFLSACASFGGFSALAQTIGIAHMNRKKSISYIKSRVCITLLSVLLCAAVRRTAKISDAVFHALTDRRGCIILQNCYNINKSPAHCFLQLKQGIVLLR